VVASTSVMPDRPLSGVRNSWLMLARNRLLASLARRASSIAWVVNTTVTPDARSKWLAMVHGHADAFEREIGPLYQELEPVFFPGATVSASEDFVIQSDAELARAVERLHQLALFCNEAVSSALTISSHSSATTIKSTQFRKSLISAENLAKRIGQYER